MEICKDESEKIVEIWLTHAESVDAAYRASLKPLVAKYRSQKFVVAIYTSGTQPLQENTALLLREQIHAAAVAPCLGVNHQKLLFTTEKMSSK